jgi:hypothetical protein
MENRLSVESGVEAYTAGKRTISLPGRGVFGRAVRSANFCVDFWLGSMH